MAKEVAGQIKLQIKGGAANGPPLGLSECLCRYTPCPS